jgi:hypothetical protein
VYSVKLLVEISGLNKYATVAYCVSTEGGFHYMPEIGKREKRATHLLEEREDECPGSSGYQFKFSEIAE